MNALKKYIILLIPIILSGCGFHLRGTMNLPPQMHTLYLQSSSPYTPFMRQLRSMLKVSHVHLVNSRKLAPLTLNIVHENFSTTETSIGGSQEMRNYNLVYSVNYTIKDSKGNIIYGPKIISSTKTVIINANEILSNSSKVDTLKREMYQDLIIQLSFQLTSNDLTQTLQKHLISKNKH